MRFLVVGRRGSLHHLGTGYQSGSKVGLGLGAVDSGSRGLGVLRPRSSPKNVYKGISRFCVGGV